MKFSALVSLWWQTLLRYIWKNSIVITVLFFLFRIMTGSNIMTIEIILTIVMSIMIHEQGYMITLYFHNINFNALLEK